MILIVSHKEDYTTDYVVNILNSRGVEYLRFNTDDIDIKHNLSVTYGKESITSIDGISKFSSVWFRRTAVPTPKFSDLNQEEFYKRDFRLFLNSFWQGLKSNKWLSHPDFIYRAENKLRQISLAHKIGFQVPETVISTEKSRIIELYKKYDGHIILKPLYGGKYHQGSKQKLIFTNLINKEHLTHSGQSLFPIIFQEEIKKEYELRVNVVNDKVFSAKVDSQSNKKTVLDWRRKKLKFDSYQLPTDLNNKCLELIKRLGLNFGAIDIIKRKNNYVFLEVNPNGQWAWLEKDTNLKISDAIIDYLI